MKISLLTTLLFLCTNLITAKNTFILGKITNPEVTTISVSFLHNVFTNEYANLNFPINENGNFSAELEIDIPTIAYFRYQGVKFQVYVEPQKDIGVFFDGKDIETSTRFFEILNFENNITRTKFYNDTDTNTDKRVIRFTPNLPIYVTDIHKIKSLNPDDRFQWIQFEARKKFKYFIENIKSNRKTSKAFQRHIYSNINYKYLSHLQTFVDADSLNESNLTAYNKLFAKEKINSIDYLNHPMYLKFLDAYAIRITRQHTSEDIDYSENVATIYETVKKNEILEQPMKEHILGRLLYHNLHPSKVDLVNPLYDDFVLFAKNEEIKKDVKYRYEDANKFASSSPAPQFELENNLGQQVKLADFKGKKVYLLFWAKWCAYCKMEIKNSTQNRADLKPDELTFIYISMDDSKSTWLEHQITNEEKVTHVWGKGMHSEIKTDYGIVNLPRNFLIDEEGNFIEAFPKSDSEEFVEFIRGL